MCAVNDSIRAGYRAEKANLESELEVEVEKKEHLEQKKEEVQQLIDEAQCAIDNLGNCNFGGDRIISSVRTSQTGYKERMDYYDEFILKCQAAIEEIETDIANKQAQINNLPVNCGSCLECCPPVPSPTLGGTDEQNGNS